MNWNHFVYFATPAVLLWMLGAWAAWKSRGRAAFALTAAGLLVFFSFILAIWISLERPPLRTMGETRLWYSFFLPLAGIEGSSADRQVHDRSSGLADEHSDVVHAAAKGRGHDARRRRQGNDRQARGDLSREAHYLRKGERNHV